MGLPTLASMNWLNLQWLLIRNFIMIGCIHFSHTLSESPHICQSTCHTQSSISSHTIVVSGSYLANICSKCRTDTCKRRLWPTWCPRTYHGMQGIIIPTSSRLCRCPNHLLYVPQDIGLDFFMSLDMSNRTSTCPSWCPTRTKVQYKCFG